MREPELTSIINRLESELNAKTAYSKQIELLTDLVNYGSNLIVRAYDSSKRDIDDVMITAVLLKHIVQMLDGVQLLISAGNAHAATLQARSAFEAYLYMLWIMKGDSIRKSRYYYVFEIRKQRKWALRATPNTKEREKFMETYKEFDFAQAVNWDKLAEMAKTNLLAIDSVLSQPTLKSINDMIEKTKQNDWYKALGMQSIKQIAIEVNELAVYDLYYTKFSDVMHASSYREQIEIKNHRISFEPIRYLADAQVVILLCCHVAIHGYRVILEHYHLGEIPNFKQKYIKDWRDAMLNNPSVNYNIVSKTKLS